LRLILVFEVFKVHRAFKGVQVFKDLVVLLVHRELKVRRALVLKEP
jgi:hypothetical protein